MPLPRFQRFNWGCDLHFLPNYLALYPSPHNADLKKSSENIVDKRENAGYMHFLFFHQHCFLVF